jgi:hypothetical protein
MAVFSIRQRLSFVYVAVSDAIPLDIIGYVGTIFWISGTFGPRAVNPDKAPYLGDYTVVISPGSVSALFISLALGTHLLLPFLYTLYTGPFNTRADWYPLSTNSKVHRAKKRGELRLETGGTLQIVVPTKIVESARNYTLEFESTAPLEIEMWDEPNDDQNWNRDSKTLFSEDIVHDTFTPVFTIENTDDLGTGGNHHIRITNHGWKRQRTIMEVPVVE